MPSSLDNVDARNDETFDIIGCDILLIFNFCERFKTVAIRRQALAVIWSQIRDKLRINRQFIH